MSEEETEYEDDIATLLLDKRQVEGQSIIKNHVIIAMVTGMVPIPILDAVYLVNTQFTMLQRLSMLYEIPFTDIKKSLIISLSSGVLPVVGVVGMSSFLKVIPGIGSLAGSASVSISGGAMTYAVGRVFLQHFEQGGDFENLDMDAAKSHLKQELKAGKQFATSLISEVKALAAEKKNKD